VAQPLTSVLVRPSELTPGILARAIQAGEPLLDSDVVGGLVGGSGRTMSLPVSDRTVQGLGLVPGDQVDVIGLDAQKSPIMVVEGAWIVRLAGRAGSAGLGAAYPSEFVTVEVDRDQALDLTAALANGELQLLRSTGTQDRS
jgi:Flp pilus assembly protein CpaB